MSVILYALTEDLRTKGSLRDVLPITIICAFQKALKNMSLFYVILIMSLGQKLRVLGT